MINKSIDVWEGKEFYLLRVREDDSHVWTPEVCATATERSDKVKRWNNAGFEVQIYFNDEWKNSTWNTPSIMLGGSV